MQNGIYLTEGDVKKTIEVAQKSPCQHLEKTDAKVALSKRDQHDQFKHDQQHT